MSTPGLMPDGFATQHGNNTAHPVLMQGRQQSLVKVLLIFLDLNVLVPALWKAMASKLVYQPLHKETTRIVHMDGDAQKGESHVHVVRRGMVHTAFNLKVNTFLLYVAQ